MASVLITGTSKGIGLEAALAFGRAGYKVHATMRNPSQSPELAQTAAREKLPITVSAMDVDSDESVRQAIVAIEEAHGAIDVLVNNAGIERSGSVEELPLADFRGHGDELFRCDSLCSSRNPADETAPKRLYHQCEFGRRAPRQFAIVILYGVEVGPRGFK